MLFDLDQRSWLLYLNLCNPSLFIQFSLFLVLENLLDRGRCYSKGTLITSDLEESDYV